jgi:hypothetical protein
MILRWSTSNTRKSVGRYAGCSVSSLVFTLSNIPKYLFRLQSPDYVQLILGPGRHVSHVITRVALLIPSFRFSQSSVSSDNAGGLSKRDEPRITATIAVLCSYRVMVGHLLLDSIESPTFAIPRAK